MPCTMYSDMYSFFFSIRINHCPNARNTILSLNRQNFCANWHFDILIIRYFNPVFINLLHIVSI